MTSQEVFELLNGSSNQLIKWAAIVAIAVIFKTPIRDTLSGIATALASLAKRPFRAGPVEVGAPEASQPAIDTSPVSVAHAAAPGNVSNDPAVQEARDALVASGAAIPEPQRYDWLLWEAAQMAVRAYFFQFYSLVYGSQLSLLKIANAAGLNGIPEDVARGVYQSAVARDPAFYATYEYENWRTFLTETGMLRLQDGRLFISARGRSLLQWLPAFGLSDLGTSNNSLH